MSSTLLSGLELVPTMLRRYYSVMRDLDKSLQGMLYGQGDYWTYCRSFVMIDLSPNQVSKIPFQCGLLNIENLILNAFKTTDLSSLILEICLLYLLSSSLFSFEQVKFVSWITNVICLFFFLFFYFYFFNQYAKIEVSSGPWSTGINKLYMWQLILTYIFYNLFKISNWSAKELFPNEYEKFERCGILELIFSELPSQWQEKSSQLQCWSLVERAQR